QSGLYRQLASPGACCREVSGGSIELYDHACSNEASSNSATERINVKQRKDEINEPGGTSLVASSPKIDDHGSYRALQFRDFRLLVVGAFLSMFGRQMLTIAIGWELYERTGSALVLGGVGLAQ